MGAQAGVAIEVGPGLGALVIYPSERFRGLEIEISPAGARGGRRSHARVRARPVDTGTGYAAIYPGLPAGRYTIWRDHLTAAATVMIPGGKVTRFDWR